MLELHFPITHTETNETFMLASDEKNNFFIVNFKYVQEHTGEFYIPYDNQKDIEVLKDNNRYFHYKGDIYRTLFVAKHFVNKEKFVIYKKDSDSTNNTYWARPFDMFHGIQIKDDGSSVKRFTLIEN